MANNKIVLKLNYDDQPEEKEYKDAIPILSPTEDTDTEGGMPISNEYLRMGGICECERGNKKAPTVGLEPTTIRLRA